MRRAAKATFTDYSLTETGQIDLDTIRYSDAVKDVAYRAWFECRGNATEVVRLLTDNLEWRELARLGEGDPIPKPATVRHWARIHYWQLRAESDMRELAPISGHKAAVAMAYRRMDYGNQIHRIAMNDVQEKPAVVANMLKAATVGWQESSALMPHVTQRASESVDVTELTTMAEIAEAEAKLERLTSGT